jgi:hypothetical protein
MDGQATRRILINEQDAKWSVQSPGTISRCQTPCGSEDGHRRTFSLLGSVGYSTVRRSLGGVTAGIETGVQARPGQARARDLGIIHGGRVRLA